MVGVLAELKSVLNQYYEKAKQHQKLIWFIFSVFAIAFVLYTVIWCYNLIFTYPVNQVSQITNVTENADLVNKYRTTSVQIVVIIAQIFGGVAILIGLYFAWGNLTTAREGQITERFTRAIDQLGNEKLEIRLGGIYALERIAKESQEDYWPIMEILTAYVRMNSSTEVVGNNKNMHISMDIQAVLTVLGRHKFVHRKRDRQPIPAKSKSYDPGREIQSQYRNEEFMCLNLKEANLNGVKLINANFEGANLEKTNLSEAYLKEANLKGANLKEANLEKAYLWGANLEKADLWGANLEGADLGKASLLGAHLQKADLGGADLGEANLGQAYFWGANLRGVRLGMAELEGANLELANLEKAYLWRAKLKGANLIEAHLEEADLGEADLEGANLFDAHLERANIEGANLKGANLGGVNLEGANLEGTKNLSLNQLSRVKTLFNAKLDEELFIPLKKKYPALFEKPDYY